MSDLLRLLTNNKRIARFFSKLFIRSFFRTKRAIRSEKPMREFPTLFIYSLCCRLEKKCKPHLAQKLEAQDVSLEFSMLYILYILCCCIFAGHLYSNLYCRDHSWVCFHRVPNSLHGPLNNASITCQKKVIVHVASSRARLMYFTDF